MHVPPARFTLLSLIAPGEAHSARVILGLRSYRELLQHVLSEWTFDWRHGVSTRQRIEKANLDFTDKTAQSQSERYRPTPPHCLTQALRWLETETGPFSNHHLVDYGCGAGLVMILAQAEGFAKATGIELSPSLAQQCRGNLARTARKFPDTTCTVLEENAALFQPPECATVFYFFNPFSSAYFDAALARIQASLKEAPRDVYILVFQASGYEVKGFEEIAWITGVSIFRNVGEG